MRDSQKPIHATYFVSGVYLLPDIAAQAYRAPRHQPGDSAIGFGGSSEDVQARFREIEAASEEGHDIGSHANGHFTGAEWTAAEWRDELDQFSEFFYSIQQTKPNRALKIRIVGFRAPDLSGSNQLFKTLRALGYQYDASEVAAADAWPTHRNGLWQLSLGRVSVDGSRDAIPSMDYSFYTLNSQTVNGAQSADERQRRMVAAYLAQFESNYFGNRAPLQFLQHFELYHDGVYWRAMQQVAERICGLRDVHCVSGSELVGELNRLDGRTLEAYRAGHFQHAQR